MLIDLHIIQNFAPSCLNRDDTNAPKDCEFGGYRRARISSQCIKRSVRTYFDQHAEDLNIAGNLGERSRKFADSLATRLSTEKKKTPAEALKVVRQAIEQIGLKFDKKATEPLTEYLLFLDPKEQNALAGLCVEYWDELKNDKPKLPADFAKQAKATVLANPRSGCKAVDLALFGRMLADLPDNNIDAACQVAHALSTHAVDMEMDFFTAVDDLQPKGDTGAGMMGVVEFNSSCFYRYSLLDTAQLTRNLGGDAALAKSAVGAYLKASVYAIPTGKQNSMAAQNLPVYVRVVVREGAPPRSFANAFMAPVVKNREADLAKTSADKLEDHEKQLTRMYGVVGVKLEATASLYDENSDGLDSLLGKVGGLL